MGRTFTIHCDAKNLLYILLWRTLDKPKVSRSRRLTNWALSLLSFLFEIQHIPVSVPGPVMKFHNKVLWVRLRELRVVAYKGLS